LTKIEPDITYNASPQRSIKSLKTINLVIINTNFPGMSSRDDLKDPHMVWRLPTTVIVAAAAIAIAPSIILSLPVRSSPGTFGVVLALSIKIVIQLRGLFAPDFGVAILATLTACDAGPFGRALALAQGHTKGNATLTVARLGALLAEVAVFIAVAALNVIHVDGLSAVTSDVTLLATVAAAARALRGRGAILGEVSHLERQSARPQSSA
jgi:hypothetical protein